MPAFLGLLTALGPAATGAALALAHPASPSAPTQVPRDTCSYTLTFTANGALLTGTCEGQIATWGWRPSFWTTGAGIPGDALRSVLEAGAGRLGRAGGRHVDGTVAGRRRAGRRGAGDARAGGREAGGGRANAVPDARPDGRAAKDRNKSGGARRRSPGQVAAAAALSRLGTPFSWGGGSAAGPTRGIGRGSRISGFDCSGLTLYAWAKAGVKLGHYTGTQFRQGRRVAWGELRAGDLVFFGGGGGDPTHVGLYLQNGVMIHAPKTGDVVKKTNFVKSPYFGPRYRGAIRPRE